MALTLGSGSWGHLQRPLLSVQLGTASSEICSHLYSVTLFLGWRAQLLSPLGSPQVSWGSVIFPIVTLNSELSFEGRATWPLLTHSLK